VIVPHPTLSIAIIHVLRGKNLRSASSDRAGHRLVGVLDEKIVRRSHLRMGRQTLADHDNRVFKPDLRIGDAAVLAKGAKNFYASQAVDEKFDERWCIIAIQIRSNAVKSRWKKHVAPRPLMIIGRMVRAALALLAEKIKRKLLLGQQMPLGIEFGPRHW